MRFIPSRKSFPFHVQKAESGVEANVYIVRKQYGTLKVSSVVLDTFPACALLA
jgi:hypothetical protein